MASAAGSEQLHQEQVPLKARIVLSHAHLQNLAERKGINLLHVKGYIFGQDTYRDQRTSTDVDVLVRPSQVDAFIEAVLEAGWEVMTSFETGSDFHHAMTIYHPTWGLADIHREFPGLGKKPELTFDRLWAQRRQKNMGGYPCDTTSLQDSRIIVYVHSARSTSIVKPDVQYLDELLSAQEKEALEVRVQELEAELAYAAALGRIDQYQDRKDYLVWKTASEKTSDLTRWYARVQAAPSLGAKAQTVLDIFRVNRDHLAMELGHEPSKQEIRQKFFSRFSKLWRKVGK